MQAVWQQQQQRFQQSQCSPQRLLVASISRGSLVDGKGWDAVVAAAAAAMDGGMLTVNGWPAGTSPFSTPASTPRGTPLATPIASRESSSSVVVS